MAARRKKTPREQVRDLLAEREEADVGRPREIDLLLAILHELRLVNENLARIEERLIRGPLA
jgi:hypothetical protein